MGSGARIAVAGVLLAGVGVASWTGWVQHQPLLEVPAFAPFEGRQVHDEAGVLGPFGETLERQAKDWSDTLGVDVQILTLRAAGEPIEALADRLFQERKVGADAPTGGMLYLVDAAGRRARIEVSYALEGNFPDALVGRLASDQLAPYAAYSAVGMALMDVLHFMKDYALVQVASGNLTPPAAVRSRPELRRALGFLSGGAGAQVDLKALLRAGDLRERIEEPRRSRYAPSTDPMTSAEAFLRVMKELAGDPTLELFTDGSQMMRARYPMAPFEQWQRYQVIHESRPLRVVKQGERAVVVSDTPARGFVPILLWRRGLLWRVDLVETWKNLFFDGSGTYQVVNRNMPYLFAFGDVKQSGAAPEIAPLELGARSVLEEVAELEAELGRSNVSDLHFNLAELLFRNCFASVDALAHYEAAARGEPRRFLYVATMGDRAMYLGFYRYAMPFYAALGPAGYRRLGNVYWALSEYAEAARYYEKALANDPRSEQLRSLVQRARALVR